MLLENYKGRLLVSQPRNKSTFFEESVVLVCNNTPKGSWGLTLNKLIKDDSFCLADILEHVGMENSNYINAPIYVGGPVEKQRVCIVHTNEWASGSTIEITPEISVTTDISILASLVRGHGPDTFRVVCGISGWAPGQLEGEMKGEEPWKQEHRWLTCPATAQNVFSYDWDSQWAHCLTEAVDLEVKEWF